MNDRPTWGSIAYFKLMGMWAVDTFKGLVHDIRLRAFLIIYLMLVGWIIGAIVELWGK